MTTLNISLPDDMKAFIEAQVAEEGYASASDYLQAVLRDARMRKARKDLEAKLEEALTGGPPEPMTCEDWESIEREAIEGLRGESIKPRKATFYGSGARQDLIDIFRQIARDAGLKAARRFLKEADATFQRLASLPNIGTAFEPGNPRFAGLRYCPVSRFKTFIIFYRPRPDGIEVLRVLHGSRDLEGILAADIDEEADDEIP